MVQSLSTYINSPEKIDEQSVNYLKEVLEEHPYCQTAQLLYLKGLQNQSSFQYNNRLRITAAYAGNRGVLFDYITEPLKIDIPKPKEASKSISEIKIIKPEKKEEEKSEPQKPKLVASVEIEQTESKKPEPQVAKEPANKVDDKAYKPDFSKSKDKSLLSAYEKAQALIDEQKARLEELKKKEVSDEKEIDEEQEKPETKEPVVKELPKEETTQEETSIEPIFAVDAETIEEREEKVEFEASNDAEKRLDIGKPLEFDKDEMHSFSEWLQLSKVKPIQRTKENKVAKPAKPEIKKVKKKNFDLIDRFIEEQPALKPKKKDFYSPVNMARISVQADESLVTETLARVYIEQGHYGKAIKALEILRLKYPEKSSFFADQISAVKDLIKNKNKTQ